MTAAEPPADPAARVGYRITLPPGWLLLPVRDRTDEELHALIVGQYRDLPRDSAMPLVSRLADAVVTAAHTAREVDVIDIVLPLGAAWGSAVSTSIALAVGQDDPPTDGEPVETNAGIATRTQADRAPNALRRVEYVWQIPPEGTELLVASFSIVGDEDPELAPLVDALTGLCDTILATIRWETDDREPEAGEERDG
ncbi:hypothetical protein [Microbacterium aurum]